MRYLLAFVLLASGVSVAKGQEKAAGNSIDISPATISPASLDRERQQYEKMTTGLQERSDKIMGALRRDEERIKDRLGRKDSLRAAQLFYNSASLYDKLAEKMPQDSGNIPLHSISSYVPRLDSLNVLTKLLQQKNGIAGLSPDIRQKASALGTQLSLLQQQLQRADDIRAFARERMQQLSDKLSGYNLGSRLTAMNKDVYYYQQRLEQYKGMLRDPEKMEKLALEVASKLPVWQELMQRNSWLSALFPSPAGAGTVMGLAGSQTRESVEQELMSRFGGLSSSPMQYMQSQVAPSQQGINDLQNKFSGQGSLGNASEMTMPDFKPNNQKVKTFLQRLELGCNMQSQPSSGILPVTTSFALTVGYKLSDRATAGVGASYNIGWGRSLDHIRLTTQGMSLRSFLDIKARGGLWITGGFEYNYLPGLPRITGAPSLDSWQKSGLLGLTRKFGAGKRSTNLQLLYDFLHSDHLPHTSPLLFRIGYTL